MTIGQMVSLGFSSFFVVFTIIYFIVEHIKCKKGYGYKDDDDFETFKMKMSLNGPGNP